MKLTIKYEAKEIAALIREDLARQGIPTGSAEIVRRKDEYVVTVDAERDGTLMAQPEVAPSVPPSSDKTPPTPPPPLEVVEGGANPVDMTDVLAASKKNAKTNPGLYSKKPRELMEGESYEHPNFKERE